MPAAADAGGVHEVANRLIAAIWLVGLTCWIIAAFSVKRTRIAVPRLADAPFAMECKIWKTIDVNGDRMLIMGEGIQFHIRDDLWDHEAMRVHMERYHPIGRMFADRYCRTDDRVVFPPAEGVTK